MLNQSQIKNIENVINTFKDLIYNYSNKNKELNNIMENLLLINNELSQVTEEESLIETVLDVLYNQKNEETESTLLKEKITQLEFKKNNINKDLDELKIQLLNQMSEIPIPINLELSEQVENNIIFPHLDNANFDEEVIDIITTLLGLDDGLIFNDIEIIPNKIIVKNTLIKKEAIIKIVEGIQNFRVYVDRISESYQLIDEMLERLVKSDTYMKILVLLDKYGSMNINEIENQTGLEGRKTYDACYNLTRNNWSPNPIYKTLSDDWELTMTGKILVERLNEKHPNIVPIFNITNKKRENV